MKPLFTVHAGEFLVGDHIGRTLKEHFDVWLPVRDTGVDLLLTPRGRTAAKGSPIKIQVKFSRGFDARVEHPEFVARGWFSLNTAKITKSEADFWVFVIFAIKQPPIYVIVPLAELKRRFPQPRLKTWRIYLTVFKQGKSGRVCYETRTMRKNEVAGALESKKAPAKLDFTPFLGNWNVLLIR